MSVTIHLIRDAEAVQRVPGGADEYRYLTCRGRARFRRVAAILRKLGIDPHCIITSPKVRALQTAEILAEAIRFRSEVIVAPQLADGLDLTGLRDLLMTVPSAREMVVVGHEPDLGRLTGELLCLPESATLKKGGVVTVNLNLKQGSLYAEFVRLVTGGGKVIEKRVKGVERLLGKRDKTEEDGMVFFPDELLLLGGGA